MPAIYREDIYEMTGLLICKFKHRQHFYMKTTDTAQGNIHLYTSIIYNFQYSLHTKIVIEKKWLDQIAFVYMCLVL